MTSTIGIFVVFRGTRERPEWYNKFRFRFEQQPFLGNDNLGQVSQGFNRIYSRPSKDLFDEEGKLLAIKDVVQQTLNNSAKCPPNSKVFVTGHSLGGVLATLATLHIATHTNFQKPILYTFASPRVGEPTYADHFENLECYRITNSEDIVTTVPPATG